MHMISYDQAYDGDFMRLWNVVSELSEHVNQTRSFIASLLGHASEIKTQVYHAETGFALRRFNMDITKEEYEQEVIRMNSNLAQENTGLQNDNKQLSILLKEHEQAVESIMNSFRHHAYTAQLRELDITQHYEDLLSSREDMFLRRMLTAETDRSRALAKVSHLLRMAIRVSGGEKENEGNEEELCQGRGYYISAPNEDKGLEREIELATLEKENEELRLLLRLSQGSLTEDDESRQIGATRNPHILQRNRSLIAHRFIPFHRSHS